MNPNLRNFLGSCLIAGATAIYTAAVLPTLPAKIPVHFDLYGNPDRWESKTTGAWLMVWMIVGLGAMFAVLPMLSPKTKSIEEFRPIYDRISWAIPIFMAGMQIITLSAAGDQKLSTIPFGMLMCALFGFLGNILGKVTPNYYVGIRTPWTLESPIVWERTHRFTGRYAVAGSALGAIIILIGGNMLIGLVFAILPLLAAIPYSYVIYHQINRQPKTD